MLLKQLRDPRQLPLFPSFLLGPLFRGPWFGRLVGCFIARKFGWSSGRMSLLNWPSQRWIVAVGFVLCQWRKRGGRLALFCSQGDSKSTQTASIPGKSQLPHSYFLQLHLLKLWSNHSRCSLNVSFRSSPMFSFFFASSSYPDSGWWKETSIESKNDHLRIIGECLRKSFLNIIKIAQKRTHGT